jgi:F1F0 ATPase subunit 2
MTFSAISLSLAAVAGLALGLFYFGGLWLTVRKLPGSGNPGTLILGSFVVRLLVTLCGMYLVMDGKWELLVACLAGFLLMRIVLTRMLGPARSESRLSV